MHYATHTHTKKKTIFSHPINILLRVTHYARGRTRKGYSSVVVRGVLRFRVQGLFLLVLEKEKEKKKILFKKAFRGS